MKTEIFCAFFAVLCLTQCGMALKCYTCNILCSLNHNETTCADGESCSTLILIATSRNQTREQVISKKCAPAGITCEQQQQQEGFVHGLNAARQFFASIEGTVDVKCEYCSDKDFCN